jgi:hypothetical protein
MLQTSVSQSVLLKIGNLNCMLLHVLENRFEIVCNVVCNEHVTLCQYVLSQECDAAMMEFIAV